jgi:hypothetical protein
MAALAVMPGLRRSLLSITAVIASSVSLSCSDFLLGGRASARVVVQPQFAPREAAIYGSLRTFNLGVTTLRVFLTRPRVGSDQSPAVLAEKTVTLADAQSEVQVTIDVVINGAEELLEAHMEMRSGTVLVFAGSVTVVARAGAGAGSAAPVLVPVWVGPGASATRIEILPRDLTIPANGTIAFTATAYDASGVPVVDPDYLAHWQWKVDDATLGSIPITGGLFTGANKAGVARVTIFTPNRLADTVFVTLVTQQPQPPTPTTLTLARALDVVTSGASASIPVTVLDQTGAPIPTAAVTYASRAPGVATVNASGVITGVAKGQAVVVAAAEGFPQVQDSALVVVADPDGPVVISSIDRFSYPLDATITVSVFVDFRASTRRLGSTAIDVTWDPRQLVFQSSANGASGVIPTVNATLASTGKLSLAMADVAGFGGRVEMLRLTFRTATTPAVGQLQLTALELTGTDFANLLSSAVQVTHPLRVQ